MIVSKPKGGISFSKWDCKDLDIWFTIIRKQSKGSKPLTVRERKEAQRIRLKYALDKYYLFT